MTPACRLFFLNVEPATSGEDLWLRPGPNGGKVPSGPSTGPARRVYHGGPAPLAQLDRASDFGSEGWGFDSLRARHSIGGAMKAKVVDFV